MTDAAVGPKGALRLCGSGMIKIRERMRPYIVCHMMASVDGRIDCAMTEQIESGDEYYEALAELGCPSLLMGRVTMQLHYAAAEPFVAKNLHR